ncbi:MAG: hypothetical protein Q7R92_01815 [bacterium]|nr:hypothetical protein [bacterium]
MTIKYNSFHNKKFVRLASLILSILLLEFLPAKTLAFSEETTHPALTEQIIEFYNLAYPDDQITDEQKALIVQGSIDEDTAPRWINHFYDPLYFSKSS